MTSKQRMYLDEFRIIERLMQERGWYKPVSAFDDEHAIFPAVQFPSDCHERTSGMHCFSFYPGELMLNNGECNERVLMGFSTYGCASEIDPDKQIVMQEKDERGRWYTTCTMSYDAFIGSMNNENMLAPQPQDMDVQGFFTLAQQMGLTETVTGLSGKNTVSLRSRKNGFQAPVADNIVLTYEMGHGNEPTVSASQRIYGENQGLYEIADFKHVPLREIENDRHGYMHAVREKARENEVILLKDSNQAPAVKKIPRVGDLVVK